MGSYYDGERIVRYKPVKPRRRRPRYLGLWTLCVVVAVIWVVL